MNVGKDSKKVLALSDEALEQDPAERAKFLDEQCAGNIELRNAVESVLIAVQDSDDFLAPLADIYDQSLIGQQIGEYIIVERLAEGGMGTVFLAERRADNFVQKVALKFVRRQLQTKETLSRFESERKLLASLQHPYIAQLISGGVTTDDVPYLVMEYVDGDPIDVYCDNNQLTVVDRLKLVKKIALAVQAAHQSLVVHRDLKPSNVLITADGIPKLLDFGIAKLIDPSADSAGNTTVFGHQAMTPDFASPEQILDGRVTTASDVYSLGIMTYQLLTGSRPYSVTSSSFREMVQHFESLTISAPNTHFEDLDPRTASVVAAARSSSVGKLAVQLGGDLAQVIAKALQTDPALRYESVLAFSDDIERYLNGLPVSARKDTMSYRVTRFIGRNKISVGAATIALLAIISGLGISLWQADIARDQLQRAEAVSRYLGDILLSPSNNWDATLQTGADATIADVLDAAEAQLDGDLEEYPEIRVELYNKIGEARSRMEDHEVAIQIQNKAMRIAEAALSPTSPLYSQALHHKAEAYMRAGQLATAVTYYDRALETIDRVSPSPSLVKLYILNDAALSYRLVGDYLHALDLQQRAVLESYELFGEGLLAMHTNAYSNLALYQFELGMISEAESSLSFGLEAHEMYPDQTYFASGVMNLIMGRLRATKLDDPAATRHFQKAADLFTLALDADHEEVGFATAMLARTQVRLGNTDKAMDLIGNFDRFDAEAFEDPEIWMYYLAEASISLAQGHAATAIQQINMTVSPESVKVMWNLDKIDMHLLLAEAHNSLGDIDTARTELNAAQEIAQNWLDLDSALNKKIDALVLAAQ